MRILFGGCLLNIDGETVECTIVRDGANATSPTYQVHHKESGEELCTFRPYHLEGGPVLYEMAGVSANLAHATLIVPRHGLLPDDSARENA